MRLATVLFLIALVSIHGAHRADAQGSVFLEELTWMEVRDALRTGKTSVIIPTGGTEQNGPHMVLGKHNFRVKYTAGEIARRLGDTLVAPVLAYAPEGNIDPPTGHMRFPGTISLPARYFAKVVEFAARSFNVNGFHEVILIGDSGPNQAPLKQVAQLLNSEWGSQGTRVYHLTAYYDNPNFVAWLKAHGEAQESINGHAGLIDTSLLLPVYANGVRREKLTRHYSGDGTGATGDPTRARPALGAKGLELAISGAIAQIKQYRSRDSKP